MEWGGNYNSNNCGGCVGRWRGGKWGGVKKSIKYKYIQAAIYRMPIKL
jgi:hypothetical protein